MLLNAGIMPIVRLYRDQPNSREHQQSRARLARDRLSQRVRGPGRALFRVQQRAGAARRMAGQRGAADAIDYVARAAIRDMETILARRLSGVPATAIGTKWDLIGKIIEHGGRHLFDEPVWLALHNYDINHPLDYPYDAANQTGPGSDQEEYERLGFGAWNGKHWGHRTP